MLAKDDCVQERGNVTGICVVSGHGNLNVDRRIHMGIAQVSWWQWRRLPRLSLNALWTELHVQIQPRDAANMIAQAEKKDVCFSSR